MIRAALAIVAALTLAGCSWVPVYSNDNGPNGRETLYAPAFGFAERCEKAKADPIKAPDPVPDPLEPTP